MKIEVRYQLTVSFDRPINQCSVDRALALHNYFVSCLDYMNHVRVAVIPSGVPFWPVKAVSSALAGKEVLTHMLINAALFLGGVRNVA